MTEQEPKRKIFIVHADAFINDTHQLPVVETIVRSNLQQLIARVAETGHKIHRVDSAHSSIDPEADLYIIGEVPPQRALEVINANDEVWLAGLFRDVCLALIYEGSLEKGAAPEILPAASFDVEQHLKRYTLEYTKMIENENPEFAKKLSQI